MEFWLQQIRERWDVIRSHIGTFIIVILGSFIMGFGVSGLWFERELGAANATLSAISEREDRGLPPPPSLSTAPVASLGLERGISWPRTALAMLAATVSVGIGGFVITTWRKSRAVKPRARAPEILPEQPPSPPKPGPPVEATSPAVAFDPPLRPVTKAKQEGERGPQPHIKVLDAQPDTRNLPDGAGQVVGFVLLKNATASHLESCSVVVEWFKANGAHTNLYLPVLVGRENKALFSLAPGAQRQVNIMYRNYRVAPDQPMRLTAQNPMQNALMPQKTVELEDDTAYLVGLLIESGTGVATRAVVGAKIGQYEELTFTLVNQSAQRLQRPNSGTAKAGKLSPEL